MRQSFNPRLNTKLYSKTSLCAKLQRNNASLSRLFIFPEFSPRCSYPSSCTIFLTRRMLCVHSGHFSLNDDAVQWHEPFTGKTRQQRLLGLRHKIAQECRFVSTKKSSPFYNSWPPAGVIIIPFQESIWSATRIRDLKEKSAEGEPE